MVPPNGPRDIVGQQVLIGLPQASYRSVLEDENGSGDGREVVVSDHRYTIEGGRFRSGGENRRRISLIVPLIYGSVPVVERRYFLDMVGIQGQADVV
jgi:hypothetical protein